MLKSEEMRIPGVAEPLALPSAHAYVFDIDGTLLVTKDLVHWNALHQAMLEVYDVDTNIEGIQYHGKTDLSILRMAVNRVGIQDREFESRLPRALAVVRREVEASHGQIEPMVCPGIVQLLEALRDLGKLLGVASGNLESVGWRKIQAAKLDGFFSFGSFSDGCETRSGIFRQAVGHVAQQLGAEARTCFIGDTPADIQAARETGAWVVAVASGVFSFEDLRVCSPDLCLSNCGQLFGKPPA